MATYFTEGIILKRENFQESDRILTIYTKEHGKIKASAKAARKITSKLAGNLELFFYVHLMLAQGRNIDKIAASEVIENYAKLRTDLDKIRLASYLVNLLDRLTKVLHKDNNIFNLLKNTIFLINATEKLERWQAKKIEWFFIWRLLAFLGFQPEIFNCTVCHRKILASYIVFSLRRGGLVCQDCDDKQGSLDKIDALANNIKILRIIFKKDFQDLTSIRIDDKLIKELDELTRLFLEYILEEKILSR